MKKSTYPDIIVDDYGKEHRISTMGANQVITLKKRKIKVSDIPLDVVTLKCGHIVRGIAVSKTKQLFCEKDAQLSPVVKVNG